MFFSISICAEEEPRKIPAPLKPHHEEWGCHCVTQSGWYGWNRATCKHSLENGMRSKRRSRRRQYVFQRHSLFIWSTLVLNELQGSLCMNMIGIWSWLFKTRFAAGECDAMPRIGPWVEPVSNIASACFPSFGCSWWSPGRHQGPISLMILAPNASKLAALCRWACFSSLFSKRLSSFQKCEELLLRPWWY